MKPHSLKICNKGHERSVAHNLICKIEFTQETQSLIFILRLFTMCSEVRIFYHQHGFNVSSSLKFQNYFPLFSIHDIYH
nr:MAG TPA: hypothetical protein [Caudoviricetes sp.]